MTRDGAFTTQDGSAGITEGFEHPAKMPRFDRARKTEDFRRTLRRVGRELLPTIHVQQDKIRFV